MIKDLFDDIAYGICSIQTLRDGTMLKSKKKELQNYKPKTPIIEMINNIVNPFLDELHEQYSWHGDWEFDYNGEKIKLIEYPPQTDWCVIEYTSGNRCKINKKWFKKMYEGGKL